MINRIDQIAELIDVFAVTYNLNPAYGKMHVNCDSYRNDELHIFNIHVLSSDRSYFKAFRAIIEGQRKFIQIELNNSYNDKHIFNINAVKQHFELIDTPFSQLSYTFYIYSIEDFNKLLAVLSA